MDSWENGHRLRWCATPSVARYERQWRLPGWLGALSAVTTVFWATGAVAAPCRLALVLAIDVSSSVDAGEDALQRGGLGSALMTPEVQDAFFASDLPVALAAYEWSGQYNQAMLLDWTVIETPGDLRDAASAIALSTRSHNDYPTAMGSALGYGATLFQTAPPCDRQVIDMAGDGISNDGFGPGLAYANFPFAGVTVNGLVVLDGEDDATLLAYYHTHVLRGPGAFVETAISFADYADAMQRKLLRELRVLVVSTLPEDGATCGIAGMPCQVRR